MLRSCLFFVFLLLSAGLAMADGESKGKITGVWKTPKQGPIKGGMVYAFNAASGPPPFHERYWRVPDAVGTTDDDGKFSLSLGEGTYYLGALKKAAGNRPGPPEDRDLFFFNRDKFGVSKQFTVVSGKTLSVGVLGKAITFKVPSVNSAKGMTAITGTVKESDGRPVAGIMVFAHLDPEMKGKPLFVSFRTGKDGKYLLQVSDAGTYYLKVRDFFGGGRPKDGDIIGAYGGVETPLPVNVEPGSVTKGIDVTVERFVDRRPIE